MCSPYYKNIAIATEFLEIQFACVSDLRVPLLFPIKKNDDTFEWVAAMKLAHFKDLYKTLQNEEMWITEPGVYCMDDSKEDRRSLMSTSIFILRKSQEN